MLPPAYSRDEVEGWTAEQVSQWLLSIQMHKYVQPFRIQSVDGKVLLQLDRVKMKSMGVSGYRDTRRLRKAIKRLCPHDSQPEGRKKFKRQSSLPPTSSDEETSPVHMSSDYPLPKPNYYSITRSSSEPQMCRSEQPICRKKSKKRWPEAFIRLSLAPEQIGIKCVFGEDISIIRLTLHKNHSTHDTTNIMALHDEEPTNFGFTGADTSCDEGKVKFEELMEKIEQVHGRRLAVRYLDTSGDALRLKCSEDLHFALADWRSRNSHPPQQAKDLDSGSHLLLCPKWPMHLLFVEPSTSSLIQHVWKQHHSIYIHHLLKYFSIFRACM